MSPKLGQKSNVRIKRNIENESCSITWVDPKTVFEPYPGHRISPFGPQKVINDPKIKLKSKVEIEENIETKFV